MNASDSRYVQTFKKKTQKSYCIIPCSVSESESKYGEGNIGLKLKFHNKEVYYTCIHNKCVVYVLASCFKQIVGYSHWIGGECFLSQDAKDLIYGYKERCVLYPYCSCHRLNYFIKIMNDCCLAQSPLLPVYITVHPGFLLCLNTSLLNINNRDATLRQTCSHMLLGK